MGTKFRLRQTATNYWDKLNSAEPSTKDMVKLNFYWLCAQLGMAYDRRPGLDSGVEMVDKFTKNLEPHSPLIKGFLLAAIWRYREVKKNDIQQQFVKLLSAETLTKISSDGMDILDNFAEGGFQMIEKNIPSKNGWSYFMQKYHSLMRKAPSFNYNILDKKS